MLYIVNHEVFFFFLKKMKKKSFVKGLMDQKNFSFNFLHSKTAAAAVFLEWYRDPGHI